MHYILIFWMGSIAYPTSANHVEFNTQESCMSAAAELKRLGYAGHYSNTQAFCTQKG